MTVKPLHDRVLVRRLEEENKTASGIIIPDNSLSDLPFEILIKSRHNKQ